MSKRAVKPRINLPIGTSGGGGVVGGVGGGAATLPGTVSLVTGNTVVGGTHVHQLDIASHAGNDSAHHNPVTVGNTGLSLATQQLSLNLAATSGLEISSGLRLADSIAGNGLTISSKVLAVGVSGLGLSVGADAVTLTSSSNPGAAAAILASSASGYLQLVRAGLGTAPSYPLHVSAATQQARFDYNTSNYLSLTVGSDGSTLLSTATGASGGNLTLAPAGDVIFNPTGNDLLPSTGYDLNIGSLQKKYLTLHCAELWVETLVAQNTIATIGGRILVGPTTELVADLPASGAGSGTVQVKHNEMRSGDRVYMEANGAVEFMAIFGLSITAANTTENFFRVTGDYRTDFAAGTYFTVQGSTANDGEWVVDHVGYTDPNTHIYVTGSLVNETSDGTIQYRGQQGEGHFLYYVTRDLDGSGANAWYAGDAVFNTGNVGDGFIDLYSVASVKGGLQAGPTIVGNVRTSTTYNAWAEHWAIGNLSGLYGYGSTAYGAAFGKYADGYSYLTADATNGIRMMRLDGATPVMLSQWTVGGNILIGQEASGKGNVYITSTGIQLRTNDVPLISLDTSGNATFGQVATDKGNAYWNASNQHLEFRGGTDGTVVEAYIDTAGAFVAGGGLTWLDSDGFNMRADGTYIGSGWTPTEGTRISWLWPVTGTRQVGRVDVSTNTGTGLSTMELWAGYDASNYASIHITGGNAATGRVTINGRLDISTGGTELQRAINALADDASSNLASGGGTSGIYVIACTSEVNICIAGYSNTSGAYIVSDPGNVFRVTDTDGYHCLLVSGSDLQVKNRRGGARNYRVHRLY